MSNFLNILIRWPLSKMRENAFERFKGFRFGDT